jgi:hypothetical protein
MRHATGRWDAPPDLPTLDAADRTLLERADGGGDAGPLHALVVDHALARGGPVLWVDAGGHAVTTSLRRLAPHDRVLDRVRVARGFTPYQHTSLLRALADRVASDSPSLVVLPAVDAPYRDDVRGRSGRDLLLAALADVARATRDADVPVLVTRRRDDAFAAPVEAFATATLAYRETAHGPRFVGDDETTVYRLGGGWVQTTFAFWADVLAARRPLYEADAPEVARGSN